MWVLSQMPENRKVEARKSLIFQHTIFAFGLTKANLRQIGFCSSKSTYPDKVAERIGYACPEI